MPGMGAAPKGRPWRSAGEHADRVGSGGTREELVGILVTRVEELVVDLAVCGISRRLELVCRKTHERRDGVRVAEKVARVRAGFQRSGASRNGLIDADDGHEVLLVVTLLQHSEERA
jgi:hypothetical protein